MSEALEEVYRRCDTEEMACQRAATRYEAARTPIGRILARMSLSSHQAQLAEAHEEAETGEFQIIQSQK